MENNNYSDIDSYIEGFPSDIQLILRQVRETIKKAAPDASEKISYRMPTYYMNGNLVHFAAFTHHIGFYPTPTGIEKFNKELAIYKSSKGAVQFPIDKPMPLELITKIVLFRVEENRTRAKK